MNKDILFYSNFCFHCKNILNLINKNPDINNNLLLFCIDNNKNKVPSFIKSVPCILTTNKNILIGKEVFNLITNTPKTPSQYQNNQNNQNNQNEYKGQETNNINKNSHSQPQKPLLDTKTSDPIAWHIKEMGNSFSDNYSFLESDKPVDNFGESSISHNFSFLNNIETSQTSFNIPAEPKKEEKKDYLSERMEALMNSRDGDLPKEIKRI
jgi:glutaredoxin-related protein